MEKPEQVNTPAFGVTPLGVTIARKQWESCDDLLEEQQMSKAQQRKEQQQQSSKKKQQLVTTTSVTKKLDDGKPPKNASWMALVEGVTLYGLCLVLPSMLGILLDRQQVSLLWEETQLQVCRRSAWICWHVLRRTLETKDETAEAEPLTFDNFAGDTYVEDLYVILLMTLGMALFRVLLVHMLVPNHLAPQQMEALVRCKSLHLLSSDYRQSLTPRETPRSVITLESFRKEQQELNTNTKNSTDNQQLGGGTKTTTSLPSLPLMMDLPPGMDSPTQLQHRLETPTRPTTTGQLHTAANDDTISRNLNLSAFQGLSAEDDNHNNNNNDWGLSMGTPVQKKKDTTNTTGGTPLSHHQQSMGGFLGSCGPSSQQGYDSDNWPLVVDDSEHDDNDGDFMMKRPPSSSMPLDPNTPTKMFQQDRPSTPLDQALLGDNNNTTNNDYDGGNDDDDEGFLWKRRGSTASLAAAAAAAVQEEEDDHSDSGFEEDEEDNGLDQPHSSPSDPLLPSSPARKPPSVVRRRPQRLFAAPRYATAVFRLLYCTLSCTMALYLFRDADFWPSYVGGHGNTARCWDLSGSLALAKNLDSDFDHRNTVLRRFFLVQASYHLHSGAFHVFSVLLLFVLKKADGGDGSGPSSQKKNWMSLLRSLVHPRALLQHTLSLFFLSVSYVFSSLRRLGAIGMFALDMSSLAMHLLQTCLNAPSDSFLNQKRVIRGVWALLVVPSFFYFRFYVWPMVGYSARVESEQWLAQLESTLVPGSARWFRWTFQAWMALWMGFHAIHFKRLFFHPHIQRIMTASSEDATKGAQNKA